MPSSFECYAVLGSYNNKRTPVIDLVSKLHGLSLISKEFKTAIIANEAPNLRKYQAARKPSKIGNDFDIEGFDKKMLERLGVLEALISQEVQNSGKVKHGAFLGQPPRPMREISAEFLKLKNHEADTQQVLRNIITIAGGIGENHPIKIAAQKCEALLGTIYKHDQVRLGY